jgi:hypothetical protein
MGLSPEPVARRAAAASPAASVISITETVAGSPRASGSSGLCYLDSSLLAMVRLNVKGVKEVAEMRPGAGVWAEYRFQGEDWKVSEMPSMMLQKPPEHLKRPAANMKRPAKATKKPAARKRRQVAKLPVHDEGEEEGEANDDDLDDECDEKQFEEHESVESPESPEVLEATPANPPANPLANSPGQMGGTSSSTSSMRYCKMYYKDQNAYGFRQLSGSKSQVFQVLSKSWPRDRREQLANDTLERLNSGQNVRAVAAWAKAKAKED